MNDRILPPDQARAAFPPKAARVVFRSGQPAGMRRTDERGWSGVAPRGAGQGGWTAFRRVEAIASARSARFSARDSSGKPMPHGTRP